MRIENRTPWNTAHLRAFAQRVAASTLEASQRKKLVVTFISSRTRGESGYAHYGLVYSRRLGIHFSATVRLPTGKLDAKRERFLSKWQPGDANSVPEVRARWTAAKLPNKRAIAHVLEHEMLHAIGQRHPRSRDKNVMSCYYNDDWLLTQDRLAWADEMPLAHDGRHLDSRHGSTADSVAGRVSLSYLFHQSTMRPAATPSSS